MFVHRGNVAAVFAQAEQRAMDLRMQSLDPAVHHFRKPGHVRNVAHFDSGLAQDLCRASGADDFDAEGFQLAGEIGDARFVRDANQRAPYLYQSEIIFFGHSQGFKL